MSFAGHPAQPQDEAVTNDGFWTDLETGDLINRYRIPAEYDHDVVLMGLILAVVPVNEALAKAKTAMVDAGHVTFAAYAEGTDQINGATVLETQYRHAVYCRAKANLLQQFNSMNRKTNINNLGNKADATNPGKESPDTEYYWLDQSDQAIGYILKKVFPDDAHTPRHGLHVELL